MPGLIQRSVRILFFLLVVKPLLGVVLGMNVFNRHYLPVDHQCVVIANHNSHLDALALMNLFPLRKLHEIRPVAAADYFMTNPVMAWFATTCMNIIPIPRTGITKTNNPITAMEAALAEGQSLIVFPEGTRGDGLILGAEGVVSVEPVARGVDSSLGAGRPSADATPFAVQA